MKGSYFPVALRVFMSPSSCPTSPAWRVFAPRTHPSGRQVLRNSLTCARCFQNTTLWWFGIQVRHLSIIRVQERRRGRLTVLRCAALVCQGYWGGQAVAVTLGALIPQFFNMTNTIPLCESLCLSLALSRSRARTADPPVSPSRVLQRPTSRPRTSSASSSGTWPTSRSSWSRPRGSSGPSSSAPRRSSRRSLGCSSGASRRRAAEAPSSTPRCVPVPRAASEMTPSDPRLRFLPSRTRPRRPATP